MVALPDARRRLRLDDALRVGLLARRFAPAVCLGLDDGACAARSAAGDADEAPRHPGVLHLAADGSVDELAA